MSWADGNWTSGGCDVTLSGGTLTVSKSASGNGAMADYEISSQRPWHSNTGDITSIVIGSGVTHIGICAFQNCYNTSITIPASVESIGDYAFNSCSNLATVTFAAGSQLTTIGNCAFAVCDNAGFTSITIPASVTSIGEHAFLFCRNLATVTVYAPSCTLGTDAFGSCNLSHIYVFSDRETYYEDAENWSTYSIIISEIPNSGNCGATGHESDVKYVLTGTSPNYTLNIMKVGTTGAMADYNNASVLPWYSNRSAITSVVISDGVTTIGKNAFYGHDHLAAVSIAASVTSIGESAFEYCRALGTVTFVGTSQLKTIGDRAFYNNAMTSIALPATLETIGINAFNGCGKLESITIPATVETIGDYAFVDCGKLESITVDANNVKYASEGGVLFNKDKTTLIQYPAGNAATSYTIPASVTSIGDEAFYGCTNLVTVAIPASVTTIGDEAFFGCNNTNFTSITIPASVTSIGNRAFSGCTYLATVTVYAPSCTLGSNAFDIWSNSLQIYVFGDKVTDYQGAANWHDYSGLISAIPNSGNCGAEGHASDVKYVLTGTSPNYTLNIMKVGTTGAMADYNYASAQPWNSYKGNITTIEIESGVTNIGNLAFYNCTGLTSVTIPASVTSIGKSAFKNCINLASIIIPGSGATTIGNNAFEDCKGVTTITIGDGVTSVGDFAFMNCGQNTTGTTVTIGSGLTSIGITIFYFCYKLKSIEVDANNAYFASEGGVLFNKDKTTLIQYPVGNTATSYTIPASVTSIGGNTFEKCSSLSSVTIPASVTSIGNGAFVSCTGLTSVTIPARVTSIGMFAFQNCI